MTKNEFDSKFTACTQKVLSEYTSRDKVSELFKVKDSKNPTLNELISNTYRVLLDYDRDLLYTVLAEVLEVGN